jgi:23S rRNA (adenine-N6)-dimethyltransferase
VSRKRNRRKRPPVWVSQNFLTSHKTIRRVIRKTSIAADDHVIEIGPGKGHTTALLLQRCRKVTAVELDEKLYKGLLEKFGEADNLKLCHADFLQWRLPASGSYKVYANIPFCHTTGILRKLTESRNPPDEAWLTLEKGAARRFMGRPHENLRSLMLKPVFDADIVYRFRREDFHPKPGVDVVMVRLRKKAKPEVPPDQWNAYERFVSYGLRSNCRGLRRLFTEKQLYRAIRDAGVHGFSSGEMIYVQWLYLFRCYWEHVLHKH